jgi:transposase-like protein
MMAERGIDVVSPTILRWVQHYVPEFEKHWQRYARPVGPSWRVDETYLYRAMDTEGDTVDVLLSARGDMAAKRFFEQAVAKRGMPQKLTLDGYAASHEALATLQREGTRPADLIVRTNRYLNNVIEQDHCHVKQRVKPLLGVKCFSYAASALSGIE